MMRFILALLVALLVAPTAYAADSSASELDTEVRLNPSITVTGDVVHLGDIFSGYLSRPEKIVGQAPRPGQRVVLTAEWLTNLAHTYGLAWRPTSTYDRAIVYQPGKTVSAQEIVAAVKGALVAKGLSNDAALMPSMSVENVTVAASSATEIGVREAFYDEASKGFSAVVEIPAGDPKATFVPLRGRVVPTVTVPVLKENVAKNTVITTAVIDFLAVRAAELRPATITNPTQLIGKSPKSFIKAGQPVLEGEVSTVNLVDVPVFAVEVGRDTQIGAKHVVAATFNASELPADVVLDGAQLMGKTPRRLVPAGVPIRHADVQLVRRITVPVVARDLPRGEMLSAADLSSVTLNDAEVVGNVITDVNDIVGRSTKHSMRAGQMLHTFDIARPTAVERGRPVTIVFAARMMNLTVQGVAEESGGVGDVIRVSNTKTRQSLAAEVLDARTVRVLMQQAASAN